MNIISSLLTKLAMALTSLAALLGLAHAPVAGTATISGNLSTTTPAVSAALTNSTVSTSGKFSDKNWVITFTVKPDWSVNEILDASNKLHQLQLSNTKNVIFISKDEAIGFSDALTYTTATRMIAGQNVEVRTYTKPDSTFAYYQTFALKEADGTYNFLLKGITSDTSVTDAFVASIQKK